MSTQDNDVNDQTEEQVDVCILSDDEFEAKDWPEYGVQITPEYTEPEFQRDYIAANESLETILTEEGWKRGIKKPDDDFDLAVDPTLPHRSLSVSIWTDNILCPRLLSVLLEFLRLQKDRWMITVADERSTPETGFYVDFKMVVERDTISVVINDEDILDKLGIQSRTD